MGLDVEALETSFDLVAPRGAELMDEFEARLVAAEPAVRLLFPRDLKTQKTMLLAALVLLRASLRDLDTIVPTLRKLGACNAACGARPEHYTVVAAVLIESMRAIAGPAWKLDYEEAWEAALEIVAGTMLAGAAEAELAAAA